MWYTDETYSQNVWALLGIILVSNFSMRIWKALKKLLFRNNQHQVERDTPSYPHIKHTIQLWFSQSINALEHTPRIINGMCKDHTDRQMVKGAFAENENMDIFVLFMEDELLWHSPTRWELVPVKPSRNQPRNFQQHSWAGDIAWDDWDQIYREQCMACLWAVMLSLCYSGTEKVCSRYSLPLLPSVFMENEYW